MVQTKTPEARAISKVTANLQTRFRPGRFSDYPAESGSTGWEDGLGHLLHPGNLVNFTFTSFNKGEADSDLARLLAHCDQEVEVVARCEENSMRSHRTGSRTWMCFIPISSFLW